MRNRRSDAADTVIVIVHGNTPEPPTNGLAMHGILDGHLLNRAAGGGPPVLPEPHLVWRQWRIYRHRVTSSHLACYRPFSASAERCRLRPGPQSRSLLP